MNTNTATEPATREELYKRLDALGIKTKTTDHDPVFTVAESDQLELAIPGAHTKNLFLKDAKGRLFLIIAQSTTNINLKSLPAKMGSSRLSFGKPELLLKLLGVPPGSVTAFALMNDRKNQTSVVIDAQLMDCDIINCHPLRNNATTSIARDDLLRFIRDCGHQELVVDFQTAS